MGHVKDLKTGIKYKNTPIGKIPVDWEVISLRDVSEINMGQSPPSEDCNEKEEGLPFYQGNAEFGSKYPSPKKWCEKPKKIADEGDILISVRAPVGEINIAPHKCCIGRGLAAITAKSIHSQFLYHLLFLRRKYLQKISQGSTFEAINSKELSDLFIFLPAVTEQKKIAEILTTLDEAIEKTDQIIEKTKEVKKGLMQKLLTCGIGHKKFKKTEIGEIPEEWEVTSIHQICKIKRGASPRPIGDPSFFSETGRGWIRISDVTSTYKYLKKTSQYLSEKGVSRSVKVNQGNLIMSICATIGKPVLLDMEACIHDGFVLFSELSEHINSEFLFYFLQKIENKFACKGQIGTQGNLNTDIVKRTILPIPSPLAQKRIVQILSSIDHQIEKESIHKEQLETLKKGLMQVLLTGKIRVS